MTKNRKIDTKRRKSPDEHVTFPFIGSPPVSPCSEEHHAYFVSLTVIGVTLSGSSVSIPNCVHMCVCVSDFVYLCLFAYLRQSFKINYPTKSNKLVEKKQNCREEITALIHILQTR